MIECLQCIIIEFVSNGNITAKFVSKELPTRRNIVSILGQVQSVCIRRVTRIAEVLQRLSLYHILQYNNNRLQCTIIII